MIQKNVLIMTEHLRKRRGIRVQQHYQNRFELLQKEHFGSGWQRENLFPVPVK